MCRLDRLRESVRPSAGGMDTHSQEEPVCLAPNTTLETWEEKAPIPFQIKMKTCEFVTNLEPCLDRGHRLPCIRTSEFVIEVGNEVCPWLPCQGHRTPEPQSTEH